MYNGKLPKYGPFRGFVIAVIIVIILCAAVILPFLFTVGNGGL
jgi:hypothetical protein